MFKNILKKMPFIITILLTLLYAGYCIYYIVVGDYPRAIALGIAVISVTAYTWLYLKTGNDVEELIFWKKNF